MKDAGLGSLCGTAAEILVDEVRSIICPGKVTTEEWVRIIKEAHSLGIKSTATIMYGHCDTDTDRVSHLSILREIQDQTGGFTEFVPLSFIHMNTPLYRRGLSRAGATGREDLLMTSVSRLFLDNIPHIQASWVKTGIKMAQLGLLAGADDLGGTLFEESISKGAGAVNTDYLDPAEMERIAADIGRPSGREQRCINSSDTGKSIEWEIIINRGALSVSQFYRPVLQPFSGLFYLFEPLLRGNPFPGLRQGMRIHGC